MERTAIIMLPQEIWVNGYNDCPIKSSRVRQAIVDTVNMTIGNTYYQCAIGTTTKGIAYQWYPASMVTLIRKPLRVRSRRWQRHNRLTKPFCRKRRIVKKGVLDGMQ